MTIFLDGPAKGQHLSLRLSPKLLRVTCAEGKWDALDAPTDTPEPGETLYAYKLADYLGRVHINRGKHGSGFFSMASYRFLPDQPTQEEMRTNKAWFTWCGDRLL